MRLQCRQQLDVCHSTDCANSRGNFAGLLFFSVLSYVRDLFVCLDSDASDLRTQRKFDEKSTKTYFPDEKKIATKRIYPPPQIHRSSMTHHKDASSLPISISHCTPPHRASLDQSPVTSQPINQSPSNHLKTRL